jgi:hypothetical protein
VPADPTLNQPGDVDVTIKAETIHVALARLWLLPPGATNWVEPPREIAAGSTRVPATVTFPGVERQTFLGWNLSVGKSPPGVSDYRITLTLTQKGLPIKDGVLTIEGRTDANGVDVDIDSLLLL